jgi:hypothetical protein
MNESLIVWVWIARTFFGSDEHFARVVLHGLDHNVDKVELALQHRVKVMTMRVINVKWGTAGHKGKMVSPIGRNCGVLICGEPVQTQHKGRLVKAGLQICLLLRRPSKTRCCNVIAGPSHSYA